MNKEILFVGHPRCGSKFCSHISQKLGLNVIHEHGNKFDNDQSIIGLSSWCFTVTHEPNDGMYGEIPRMGLGGNGWTSKYKYKHKIVHIRNPLDALPAIMQENDVPFSYKYRKKYIENQLGKTLYGNKLQQAIQSYLYWYQILENQDDVELYFRIEYDTDKLVDHLKQIKLLPDDYIFNNQINNRVNSKPRSYVVTKDDFDSVEKDIIDKLIQFCIKYGYKTINEYF